MSKKKIALVGFRLNMGGADRVMANLSNYFDNQGLDVHIIVFHDELGYDHSGTVFNLGKLKSNANTILNKIKRFYQLYKYIKQQEFDFIIDFRFRINRIQELLITKLIYRTNTIYTVHHSRLNYYMPDFSVLARLMYRKSYAIVSITQIMKLLIERTHKLNNIINIYNPIDISLIQEKAKESTSLKFEFVIAVGQYDTNIKQFDKLIESYAKSTLTKKGIHLVILGTGKLKKELLSVSKSNHVEAFVHLLGFKSNPFKYIIAAKFCVLSSESEGLPMVLLEALACGTPLVAFDCPTGPREIIVHKENGLLVEHQNVEKLIEAMNLFIENESLYMHCKKNALLSANKFSIDEIGEQWMKLLKYN